MKKRFVRPNPGKEFENIVESALQDIGIPYSRENVARMGVKASKGKYDFRIGTDPAICFDCKSVERSSNMTMPPMLNSMVHSHQLKALREEQNCGNLSGLLIQYRGKINKVYWLGILDLNKLHCDLGLVSSIKPEHCEKYGVEILVIDNVLDIQKLIDMGRI